MGSNEYFILLSLSGIFILMQLLLSICHYCVALCICTDEIKKQSQLYGSNYIYIYIYMCVCVCVCGAEGFGKAQPISYQVLGPCQGGRNARGRTKGIQTARIYCRGRPCPWQTKITEGESATLPEAVPSSIPKEVPSPMAQP